MLIIYLHGFNSSGNGETAKQLKEIYGENCITPTYDYCNPVIAHRQISRVLLESFNQKEECVLVGTSLGGFWANYFAEKYNLKCVLVNPSLFPQTSLKKYLGENKNYSTNKKVMLTPTQLLLYEKYQTKLTPSNMKIVLVGAKDNVVDPVKTISLMKEHKVVVDKEMGHRVSNIQKVVSLIDEAVYSYAEEILEEKTLLVERVINLLPQDINGKKAYADEVWSILQTSYEKVGGIQGSGFGSKEDMIKNIPFWKLIKRNGKIVAVGMYKDKHGRKRVAAGTDGTSEGKEGFAMLGKEDLQQKRAYGEVSGPSLSFALKQVGEENFIKNLIEPREVEKILDEPIIYPVSDDDSEVIRHPGLKSYFYQRDIGGDLKTKVMMGTPGNKIS